MQRFYFSTANGKRYPDTDGTVLPDLTAARVEAIKLAGELLQEFPERFWDTGSFTVEVADERHLTLFTVDVSTIDAPAITGPAKPKTR
jgi:hypothetical protein